jgi:hypothetical protein
MREISMIDFWKSFFAPEPGHAPVRKPAHQTVLRKRAG